MIQCLINHLLWLLRLLTAALSERSELSLTVAAFDQLERDSMVRSMFWPRDLPPDANLRVVLLRLKREYEDLLRLNPPFLG